jgi:hypothetical protein
MQFGKVINTVSAVVLVAGIGFSGAAFAATDSASCGPSKMPDTTNYCCNANKVYSVGSTIHKGKLVCHMAGEPFGAPTVAYWRKGK